MKRLSLFGASLLLSALSYGQYCMTGGPSSTADSNLESLTLIGISGGINYVGCPGVTGVEHYTAQTTTLNAGSSYGLTVHFGTCGGNYPGVGEVWIDFNGDYIFSPSESILTWNGTPPVAAGTYVISVPAGALSGSTRMRVIQAEGSSIPLDPCANFTWGSVTDFDIEIVGGVDCSTFIGDDINDPRIVPSIPFNETHQNSYCYSNENPVYVSPDVYYLVTPSALNSIEVSLCGSAFDTYLSVQDKYGNVLATNDDHVDCGTQSKLTFACAGYDSLYVVVEGWGMEMGDFDITINEGVLSTLELQNQAFNIYPNPGSDFVQIGNNFQGRVQLISSEGRLVLDKEIDHKEKVDVSQLKPGFYIVRLSIDNTIYEEKLIIE